MKKVSVVLPCYNEQKIIEETLKKVSDFSRENPTFDFIFVDDGSKDKTGEIIKKNIANSKKIKLITLSKNSGKGMAVKQGVLKANQDIICFLDSDLAYSLDHLIEMTRSLEKSDVVIGSRAITPLDNAKRIKKSRIFIGKSYNLILRLLLGLPYLDTQAGVKGFRKEAAEKLFSKQKMSRFSFDVELLYLAKKLKYKVIEMPAKVSDEHQNQVSQVNIVRDSINMFRNIFEIKLNDLRGKYD